MWNEHKMEWVVFLTGGGWFWDQTPSLFYTCGELESLDCIPLSTQVTRSIEVQLL